MTVPSLSDILDLRVSAAEAHEGGRADDALAAYQKILALSPQSDDVMVNMAEIYINLGHIAEAVGLLQSALAIKPQNHLAWYNLATAAFRVSQWENALTAINETLALVPDMAVAHFTQGNVFHMMGRHHEAIESFKNALRIDETYADAWSNMGVVYCDLSMRDEGVQCYLLALKYNMSLVSAHANLALVMLQIGRYGDAQRSADRALALDPNHADTLNTLGTLYANRGEHEKAVSYFRKALAVKPDFWKAHSNLLFCVLHKDGTTLAEVKALHQEWYDVHGIKDSRTDVQFDNAKDPNRRLRVGFVSGDFRNHPVGFFVHDSLTHLKHENLFDIYLYANQFEENIDYVRDFMAIAGENWHPIWNIPGDKVAEMIKDHQIDVLFDLTGHNSRHRLDVFCRRGAPVQVTWAGYMATTGVPQMDWLLGDHIQTPLHDQPYYTERLYNMPHSFIAFTPPPDAPPVIDELPFNKNGFVTFSSFNKPSKVTARAVRCWSEILRALPDSRLLMKFSGLGDDETRQFFRDQFTALGVGAEQLVFEHNAPHAELLERYNAVDIALDPMPYTGSTTTLEALWMGTPLVTLPGEIFPARHAASYLKTVGCHELIALDEADYVQKVIALARDPVRMLHYKQTLREKMRLSPMCNQDLFVPEFAKAVRHFWTDWCGQT